MKYQCDVCQWIYDEEKEGLDFEKLPESYICPICGAPKNMFSKLEK